MQREPGSLLRLGVVVVAGLTITACGGQSAPPPVDVEPPTASASPPTSPTTTTIALPPTTTPTPITTNNTSTSTSTPTSTSTSTTTTTLPRVAVSPGEEGEAVQILQTLLTERGFFREAIDGVFGPRTAQAVIAFHKATDTGRIAQWAETDWDLLTAFSEPQLPERIDEPNRIELDLSRQLLYRIVNEAVVDIIPISSGNGELYENATGRFVRARTPRGDFSLYKHYDGWRISYLGGLYRPWYFRGGYAIHGSDSVPAYPASHGCVRVPNWEADYLHENLSIGLPVHVWDS